MKKFNKALSTLLVTSMAVSLTACGSTSGSEEIQSEEIAASEADEESGGSAGTSTDSLADYTQNNEGLTFDNTKWNYDEENDVYWQIGVGYCTAPETTDYETMGIYVPGAYMSAVDNGDGTYTCTINEDGVIKSYTATTAPIVFPVNTAGYSAQAAPASYSFDGLSSYLDAGYIYVYLGMRGRDNGYDGSSLIYSGGAPWGVTDLKAAIRYYRFNKSILPGDSDSVFTFGMSGGGAQSALAGATGDSELYYAYLKSIGAAMFDAEGNIISDAVLGAMCWCPITSLDYADEAYEWNMGQYADSGTRADDTWTSALSDDLSEAFAGYINDLGLKSDDGTILTLEQSEDGIYASGTYYDYILSLVEKSLNNFLNDSTFPYTETSGGFDADGGFRGSGAPDGSVPGGDSEVKEAPGSGLPSGEAPNGDFAQGGPDGNFPQGNPGSDFADGQSGETEGTVYENAQDYIDSLNSDVQWVEYDAAANTVKITSIEAFVTHCKNATKDVGAFDDLNRAQAENNVFGNDESDSLHFDSVLANLLVTNEEEYSGYSDWDESIISDYTQDLNAVDKFGRSIQTRLDMYNPMYYLDDHYDGYQTSNVAAYWRIRTGIEQGDTASTVEANLALALQNYDGVKGVDFETVWNMAHTMAERTGSSTENFIQWVNECMNQ